MCSNMLGARSKMLRIDTTILKKVLFDKHADDFAGVSVGEFCARSTCRPWCWQRGARPMSTRLSPASPPRPGRSWCQWTDAGNSLRGNVGLRQNVSGGGDSLLKRDQGGALLYTDPVLAQSALTGRNSAPARGS